MARGEKKVWTYVVHTTTGKETFHTDFEADTPDNSVLVIKLSEEKAEIFSPHFWQRVTAIYNGD